MMNVHKKYVRKHGAYEPKQDLLNFTLKQKSRSYYGERDYNQRWL